MEFDDPFDFGVEDQLPFVATKKRKKVIGLDDLFNDHKKEQEKSKKRKFTSVKAREFYASDDDDADETENKLAKALDKFQKTIKEVDGHADASKKFDQEDVALSWGLQVFGTQRTPSPLVVPELGSCLLLQNLGNEELCKLVDHSSRNGETFLKGLLLNGWLSKLIINNGCLEKAIAKWTFDLLFYSSEESLMTSACDFWCAILLCNKVDTAVVKIEWLPSFLELKGALESFGFQILHPAHMLPDVEMPHGSEQSSRVDSDSKGPPTNIIAWIRFVNACCQARSTYLAVSTSQMEELVTIVVFLFLERQLLGLAVALQQCLISTINYFDEKEWDISCEKVANSLADRVPRNLNCLRIVECISGADARSKELRSALASQILKSCFDEMNDSNDILKFLNSISLKDKSCDLFKIYLSLVLTENWLLFGAKDKPLLDNLWSGFIRKCSTQISNTDFRPYAQEIRNRASYLLQSTSSK